MATAAYRVEEEAELLEQQAANDATPEGAASPASTLVQLIGVANLVPMLEASEGGEAQLTDIAHRVIEDYDIDKKSREDWEKRTSAAKDLAMMVAEKKDYPFVGASNVKYPLVTQAALQFNARAYPAIVQNDRVAKVKTYGNDGEIKDEQGQVVRPGGLKAARAERVSEHLSWQLTAEMPEWEPDMDRLLVILPIVGCDFKKTYFDPSLGRKCSRRVSASRFVINYFARSIDDAPRFTEELLLHPRDIQERILDGRFAKFDYASVAPTTDSDEDKKEGVRSVDVDDDDAPHLFLEQHRLLDLDGDDYREPYIVTIHKDSKRICRIVANFTEDTVRMTADGTRVASIRPQTFFTKYEFLPSPDGGFYGMGLGWLLKDTNEAINSTINQLFDAGHLNNLQGGFINAAAGIRGGKEITISKGTFKVINTGGIPIKDAIVPFSYAPPSEALFKLLGLLIEYGNDLASIKDVMTGETGGKVMQPTTVLALIEQGMKVFNAIFKRVHRAIKSELGIHGRLNRENLTSEAYNAFFDDPEQQFDPKADYNDADMDLLPVSDPTVSTKMVALAQAQMILETATAFPQLHNMLEVLKRVYEASEMPDIDKLLAPPPPPDPKEQELVVRGAEAEVATKEMTVEKIQAETAATLAKADEIAEPGTGSGPQLPPQPTPAEMDLAALKVEAERLKNEGLEIANLIAMLSLGREDETEAA